MTFKRYPHKHDTGAAARNYAECEDDGRDRAAHAALAWQTARWRIKPIMSDPRAESRETAFLQRVPVIMVHNQHV
jgi:hypothetical protein